jgi:hypothetical protein
MEQIFSLPNLVCESKCDAQLVHELGNGEISESSESHSPNLIVSHAQFYGMSTAVSDHSIRSTGIPG